MASSWVASSRSRTARAASSQRSAAFGGVRRGHAIPPGQAVLIGSSRRVAAMRAGSAVAAPTAAGPGASGSVVQPSRTGARSGSAIGRRAADPRRSRPRRPFRSRVVRRNSRAGAPRGTSSRRASCGVRMTGSRVSAAVGDVSPVVLAQNVVQRAGREVAAIDAGQERRGAGTRPRGRSARRRPIGGARAGGPARRPATPSSPASRSLASIDGRARTRVVSVEAAAPERIADAEVARDASASNRGRVTKVPATLVPRDETPLLELGEGLTEGRPADIEELAQLALRAAGGSRAPTRRTGSAPRPGWR